MHQQLRLTRTYYPVRDFVAWHKQDQLDLRPPFQRLDVWKPIAKSFLVDTVLRGLPLPIIILRDKAGISLTPKREVVDGQQRLTALIAYVNPSAVTEEKRFTISPRHSKELGGKSFEELDNISKALILDYEIAAHILPSSVEDVEVLRIFSRLNSTGSKLNEQELRNAQWQGSFRQCALDIAIKHFREWRDWSIFTDYDMSRMKEAEFVSEVIGYMAHGLRGKSQSYLDSLYSDYDDDFPFYEEVIDRFSEMMKQIDRHLGSELRDSPFSNLTWFFTLICEVQDRLYGVVRLASDRRDEPAPPNGLSKMFWERVRDVADMIRNPESLPEEVARAVTGRTTHAATREVRRNLLRG